MLELEEIAAIIYEVSKDNEWRMGRRGHLFAKRNIYGFELEVRAKDSKWALVKKNCWRIELSQSKTKKDFWYEGVIETVSSVNPLARTMVMPRISTSFNIVPFSYFFISTQDIKFFIENGEDQFEKDCVILKLFMQNGLEHYKEVCKKFRP